MKSKPKVEKPGTRKDGTCAACLGGWLCAWHQAEGAANDQARAATLRSAAANIRANEITRLCALHELESDEFQTREEKAAYMLDAGRRY